MDDIARSAVERTNDPSVHAMLESMCALTGMGFAAVARVTERRWIACQIADRIDFGLEPGDELDLKTTICDEIRESGQAVIIDDASGDPAWRTHPTPTLYGFESYISIPITLDDGSFFGTLCAIDPAPRTTGLATVLDTLRRYAAEIGRIISARS